MSLSHSLRVAALFAIAAHLQLVTAAELALDHATLGQLSKLTQGEKFAVDAFPVGATRVAPVRFERVEIYSSDAHLYQMTVNGPREVPRSARIFLRGYSDDRSARVAMSLNPDASFAEGNGSGPDGTFVLRARADASGHSTLSAESLQSSLPHDFKYDMRCGNEGGAMELPALDDLARRIGGDQTSATSATDAASHALRFATVAVDTDNPFMLKLFNNNTTSATNWIASMFNIMNTMYERDLLVRLYVGTSYYQTAATDPYTSMKSADTDPNPMKDNLDIFSLYWKNNHPAGSPTRAFAILLSGLLPSTQNSCSASGIAWVNLYCKTGTTSSGHTSGSYSVNQVCTSTNAFFGPPFSALLVGHELGHNFGANHTHCTDVTTGASLVATNTIDSCYNGEGAAFGGTCYNGSESCPASGPGAPAGTIMSYCNVDLGCGPDQQNVLQFHPTHITKVLLPDISAAPAGCLNTTDDIFFSGFE
jgi:hypothetical protein